MTDFPTSPVYSSVDPGQIAQVFDQLLTNAIKFSPGGGKVLVRIEPMDIHYWRVMVADNGIGIDKKDIPLIFTRFYQIENSSQSGGLGIGLALVKDIITGHKGKLGVESELYKGSRFYFTLPRA